MIKVGELCVVFIYKNANIDLRVTENVIVVTHIYSILAFIWHKYELCMSMQDGRKSPHKRAVSGQFGAFFMSLRAAACAVRGLCVQAPLIVESLKSKF